MATGTVLITGANGSLGIPSVKYLLTHYPTYTALLTVRNPSDENTEKLRAALSTFPKERYSIRQLDLGWLSAVKDFAAEIKGEIATKKIAPLAAVICNAYTWSIINGLKFTADDYESSMAVNHLAHLKLVLGLLDAFDPDHGKIVVLGSDTHYPGKSGLEQFPPHLPEDLDLLVKPDLDKEGEEVGRGFQRYGLSKAVAIMCAYQLQKRLKKDPKLSKISVVSMDPGGMTDARAMSTGVPIAWKIMMKGVLNPLRPVLQFLVPTLRTTTLAAKDLIEIAVGDDYRDANGYYLMSSKDSSSPESLDEKKQEMVWKKSLEWASISPDQTALKTAFD